MIIDFGYGNSYQQADIPDENLAEVLISNPVRHERVGGDAVAYALSHPIGTPSLREIIHAKRQIRNQSIGNSASDESLNIVIVTSDITRPMPTHKVLPYVLDELYDAGCIPDDIMVIIARGSHRSNTDEEHRRIVGERCWQEVSVVDSSYEDCVHLGYTSAGTPVDYDRRVAEADVRICLGNIEFHYFAGYSGGCKAIMPGVSTPQAIQANHRMMVSKAARTGNLIENPVRDDLEEATAMLGVDFIVNVVLDEHKEIVYAVAGDVVEAHRDGCRYLDTMYRRSVSEPVDIIITSQGGSPKDANLYQTQKALDNAKHIIKDGGTIIVIGACSEGLGNATFEKWLLEADEPQKIIDRLHSNFCLGGHKAAAIAMVLGRASITLVSELDQALVSSIFMTPAASVQEALDAALIKHGPEARVIAMPYGGSILPSLV